MSKHLGLVSIQNALPNAACCELSSSKPAPSTVAPVPSGAVDGVTPTSSVSDTDVPSITVEVAEIKPTVRASGPALQAILCVFLI